MFSLKKIYTLKNIYVQITPGSTAIVWGLTVRSSASLEYYIKKGTGLLRHPPYIVHIRRFDLIIKSVIVSNVSEYFRISAKSARMFSLSHKSFIDLDSSMLFWHSSM